MRLGRTARRSTSPTTTRSGARRCTATTPCSSGSASRRSSPGCRGSPSCASGRPSGRRSPGFAIDAVAAFTADDEARLMADAGIVRNRAKISAAVRNARAAQELPEGLSALLWSFAPERSAAPPGHAGRRPGDQPGVGRDGQGAQAAGLRLRRSDHRLRAHAGHRHGRRPRRRLLPGRRAGRPGDPVGGSCWTPRAAYGIIGRELTASTDATSLLPRRQRCGRRRRHAWRP